MRNLKGDLDWILLATFGGIALAATAIAYFSSWVMEQWAMATPLW